MSSPVSTPHSSPSFQGIKQAPNLGRSLPKMIPLPPGLTQTGPGFNPAHCFRNESIRTVDRRLSVRTFFANRLSLDRFANNLTGTDPQLLESELKEIIATLTNTSPEDLNTDWVEKNVWMLGKMIAIPYLNEKLGPLIAKTSDQILEKIAVNPKVFYEKQLSLIFQGFGYIADRGLTIDSKNFKKFADSATGNTQFTEMRNLSNIIWGYGKCYKIDPKANLPHANFEALVKQFNNKQMPENDLFKVHSTSRVINGMKDYLVRNSSIIPPRFVEKVKGLLSNLYSPMQVNCETDPYLCIPNLLYSAAVLGVMNVEATNKLIGFLEMSNEVLNENSLNMLYLIQQRFPKEVTYPAWLEKKLNASATLAQNDYTITKFQRRVYGFVTDEYQRRTEAKLEKTIKGLSIDIFLDYKGEKWAIECDGHDSHFNVFRQLNIATDFRDQILTNLGYHPIHITPAATHNLDDATSKKKVIAIINEKMAKVFKAKQEARQLEEAKKMEALRLAAEAQKALEEPALEVPEFETPVVEEPILETSSTPINDEGFKTSPRKRRRKRSTSPKPAEANVEVITSPSQPEVKATENRGSSVRNTARWIAGTVISAGLLAMSWYAMSSSEEQSG